MKAVEYRLPQDIDKSFIVFREKGKSFPCPWHYHPEYELVLITNSTGRRMVGDHIGYFDAGDLVFMGPKLPHVWMNDPQYLIGQEELPAEGIVIHFTEDFLGENFFNIPEMENFKKILELSGQGMVIKGNSRDKINSLMKGMVEMKGIQRLAALFTIFDILSSTSEYELLASPGFVHTTQLQGSDRFSKLSEYIIRNFDHDITLPEAASISNMAVTTFCNFFKEHYRVTFIEYLNTVRIGYVCKLLGDTDKNIVEVAYESGYKSLANFNRQFKKIKNMTPKEYRTTLNMDFAIS